MTDRMMLIPGTGGIRFKFSDGAQAPYLLEMFEEHFLGDQEGFATALGCEHPRVPVPTPPDYDYAPRLTTLRPGLQLVPDEALEGTAYQAVADFGLTTADPSRYTPFLYDWRLDVRYNAAKLAAALNAAPSGTRWNLLCHSQGGLVAIAASLRLGADAWGKLVRNVAFVGAPVVGTVRSLQAIIEGTNFGQLVSSVFARTARTWPSLYQMFPLFYCVADQPTQSIFDPVLWSELGEGGLALVDRGHRFWDDVAFQPFRMMDPNRIAFFMGHPEHPNTPVSVTSNAPHLPTLTQALDVGDTLVPWTPTMAFLRWSGLAARVLPIEGALQKDHAYLLNDVALFRRAHQFLETD